LLGGFSLSFILFEIFVTGALFGFFAFIATCSGRLFKRRLSRRCTALSFPRLSGKGALKFGMSTRPRCKRAIIGRTGAIGSFKLCLSCSRRVGFALSFSRGIGLPLAGPWRIGRPLLSFWIPSALKTSAFARRIRASLAWRIRLALCIIRFTLCIRTICRGRALIGLGRRCRLLRRGCFFAYGRWWRLFPWRRWWRIKGRFDNAFDDSRLCGRQGSVRCFCSRTFLVLLFLLCWLFDELKRFSELGVFDVEF
jgi:hypothetical protein